MSNPLRCTNPRCDYTSVIDSDTLDVDERCPRCRSALIFDTLEPSDRTATYEPESRATEPQETLGLPVASETPHFPTPHAIESTDSHTPILIGRFQIQARLGEGAFGIVYRAYDPQLDRAVALKVAKPGTLDTPAKQARFLQEAKAAANLRHPNIVPLYETGSQGDQLFICSALIEGRTLEHLIEQSPAGTFPIREAVRILQRLADALGYAHTMGIVHRDVKPQNVLIDKKGEPLLTDFGLAARNAPGAERLTQEKSVLGTPSYMAPEQADGESVAESDQYSLGCAMFEMLTGETPFSGGPAQQIFLHKTQPIPKLRGIRRDLPRDLETICEKTLAKKPADRYATCSDLVEDLRRFTAGESTKARPPGVLERFAKWVRRSPYQAATLVAAFACMTAVIFVFYGRAETAEKENEIQLNRVKELTRLDEVKTRITSLYQKIESAATLADGYPATDERVTQRWREVDRDARAALALIETEPSLSDYPLVDPTRRYLERAAGQLADAEERTAALERERQLKIALGDAVFFGSRYSGLDNRENTALARAAIARGLALYDVKLDQDGPPQVAGKFFSPQQVKLIADRCCELLLLDAELLARPIPNEHVDRILERLRQAIACIDRSDRLFTPAVPSSSGEKLRAKILRFQAEREKDEPTRTALADKAKVTLKSLVNIPPRLVADQMLAALELYLDNQFEPAMAPLTAVLRDQPDHFGAEYLLSVCRLRLKIFQEAKEGLTRCVKERPDFPWARLLRAYASMELKQYQESEQELEQVSKMNDELAGYIALVNRGVLLVRKREWEQAERDLRQAIAQRPNFAHAYLNLAQARSQRSEPSELERSALWFGPNPFLPLAAVELNREDSRRGTRDILDEGTKHCPTNSLLFHERGRIRLMLADFAGAQEDFREAIRLAVNRGATSTMADDLVELARLQIRDGHPAAAVRTLETALGIRPDLAIAHRLMAGPLLQLGKHEKAGHALDRYLATIPVTPGRPPTPEQAGDLADVLKDRGRVQEDQAKAFSGRGLIHLHQKHLRESIESYTHSLQYSRDPETLGLRGWAHLIYNAPDLAMADFNESLGIKSTDANALIGRANARIRLVLAEPEPSPLKKPTETEARIRFTKFQDAVQDAEDGVRLADGDARHLFNAARVFALSVPLNRNPKPGVRTPETVFHANCERRTAELLRRAMEATPAKDQATFWVEYVQKDRVFDSVRNSPPMRSLAVEYEKGLR